METHNRSVLDLYQLHEPGGFQHLRLRIAQHIGLLRDDIVRAVNFLGFRFGQAHGGNFGFAERYARNVVIGHDARVQSCDFLCDKDPLHRGAVRQLQTGHNVSDCINIPPSGVQAFVGQHETAIHRDALCLVTHVRCVRASSNRYQQVISTESLTVLGVDRYPVPVLYSVLKPGVSHELNPARFESLFQALRNVLVLVRHQVRQSLNDGDVCPERLPHGSKLNANDPAAQNDY